LVIVVLAFRDPLLKDKAYRILRFVLVVNFLLYLPFSLFYYFSNDHFSKMGWAGQLITVTGTVVSLFCAIVFFMVKPEKQVQKINLDNYELVTLTSTRHRFVHHLLDMLFLLPGWLSLMDLNAPQKPGPGTAVLMFVWLLGYYFLSEAIFGQTFGKLFTNSCVAGNGVEVSPGRIFVRTLSRLIPFDRLSFLFRGHWHDKASSTAVVYVDSWARAFDEMPAYPTDK
jgi:hypothetical protein